MIPRKVVVSFVKNSKARKVYPIQNLHHAVVDIRLGLRVKLGFDVRIPNVLCAGTLVAGGDQGILGLLLIR
jgi:hypothetical protein